MLDQMLATANLTKKADCYEPADALEEADRIQEADRLRRAPYGMPVIWGGAVFTAMEVAAAFTVADYPSKGVGLYPAVGAPNLSVSSAHFRYWHPNLKDWQEDFGPYKQISTRRYLIKSRYGNGARTIYHSFDFQVNDDDVQRRTVAVQSLTWLVYSAGRASFEKKIAHYEHRLTRGDVYRFHPFVIGLVKKFRNVNHVEVKMQRFHDDSLVPQLVSRESK